MRPWSVRFAILSIAIVCAAGAGGRDHFEESVTQRVTRLINQLGDDDFAKRVAASKELEAIGEPAIDALQKAVRTEDDAEIRHRAEGILRVLAARAREKELANWAGSWNSPEGVWMKITGDRWRSGTPTFGPTAGVMWVSEIKEKLVLADFAVEEGPTKGQVCKAIFRLDGDSLHYCGTYAGHYPTEFKTIGNYYSCVFKRVRE